MIFSLRGVLDFYVYKGINVVRTWPRTKRSDMSPASLAQAATFASYIKRLQATAPQIVEAARQQTRSTTWTYRDELVAAGWGTLTASS